MKSSPQIAVAVEDLVRRYNREVTLDACMKAGLGLLFSLLTFGFVFWGGWLAAFCFARSLGIAEWHIALLVTGLFFIVAAWSAWQRVDPLANVPRLTQQQWMLMIAGQAVGVHYFSPRHALAGSAVVLLGGPANLFQALGIWQWRLNVDASLVEEASHLLVKCRESVSARHLRNPAAAMLLKRLRLIKLTQDAEGPAFTATDKGRKLLGE
jgi:hypothetical protein